MKKLIILLLSAGMILAIYTPGLAQIDDPETKIENEGENRVNKNVDKGVNKGFDKIEDGVGSLFKKNKKKDKNKEGEVADQKNSKTTNQEKASSVKNEISEGADPELIWSKYDFVPGDNVIFEDNLEGEENGEFPSRWDLYRGNVENAEFGGENVIMFKDGSSCIIPFLKNPGQDYLPDIFTIEFDAYYDVEPHSAKYYVALYDKKNQKGAGPSLQQIQLFPGGIQFDASKNLISDGDGLWYNKKNPFWRHISIGFNVRSLKVYYDDVRMLNIPNLGFNPTGLSIEIINTTPFNFYIKNIRIAEGGQKLYDKFLQDGKIVTNGIRFDVNKATIKPESMGVINEIYKLMEDHPEINFSIEGHTDSDGDFDFNQSLSEQRALAIKNKLVAMGINQDRLTTKGYGETHAIDSNQTPEGKANNRRVEFVKT